ncbi:MAG TPA: hypothetical protein VFD35_12580 [Pricia sp.]|nr:hypothetical protein [Pricia sp.]
MVEKLNRTIPGPERWERTVFKDTTLKFPWNNRVSASIAMSLPC